METIVKITTDSPEQATVIIEILAEINRATAKHPNWPSSPVERAAIVAEEAGEVIREANHLREGCGNVEDLRMELIQTAGTCIRMLGLMDRESQSNARPKGNGVFALFNKEADRRFSNNYPLNGE